MRANCYCKVCGSKNPANIASCSICGQAITSEPRNNPINSASFRSPTMVIFDIDDTILNVSQRYKDAKRAGLIDKEGSPKRKKTLETPGKARKRANQFLFSPENLRKDTAIPGAIGLANDLAAQGHTIAYVTGRHSDFREVTRNQLEDKGFPIYKDDSGAELLFLKPSLGEATDEYKQGIYAKLLATYDVRIVFDDQIDNLRAAVSQGITGVYPSIHDYTKYQVRSNTSHPHVQETKGDLHVVGTDNINYASELLAEEIDRRDDETQHSNNPKRFHPGLEEARELEDTRKQVGVEWFGDDPKDYDEEQALLELLEEDDEALVHYNPPIKTDILPIMSGEPTTQHKKLGAVFAEVQVGRNIFVDVGEGIQDIYRGLIGGRQSMSEKRMAMAIATMEKELSDRAKKVGGNAIANLKLDFELPSRQGKVLNLIATADAIKMRSPPKVVRNNPSDPECPDCGYHFDPTQMGTDDKDCACYCQKCDEYIGYPSPAECKCPRNNPANPSKVEKGKKLYKHMNGKLPESVDVKKIDMGDVWYEVGEGGCWSIGYMSGKETGKAEQKYTHTFNEETKDGNFPKLYATMPENGKPMLIIQGGTWKIRTDDTGVAWIYD